MSEPRYPQSGDAFSPSPVNPDMIVAVDGDTACEAFHNLNRMIGYHDGEFGIGPMPPMLGDETEGNP